MLLRRAGPAISVADDRRVMAAGERTIDRVTLAVALLLVGLAYWFGLR
jgi:hypothetical protein